MPLPAAAEPVQEPSLAETRLTLLDQARRRFGPISAEVVVDHVLRMTVDADYPVREAALEALHRRWGFAQRDGLKVAKGPARGQVLGAYVTARPETKEGPMSRSQGHRPYVSFLEAVSPPRGSCDCPDFLRSSLGLCKHLLVVVAHVMAAAKRTGASARRQALPPARGPVLTWDPALPLRGRLDRLAGLRVEGGPGDVLWLRRRGPGPASRVRKAFEGGRVPASLLDDPQLRRDLLDDLCALLPREAGRGEDRRPDDGRLLARPAARALVHEERERAARRVQHLAAAVTARGHLKTLKRRLYPYQREGVDRLLDAGRLLLADDMGLGKTTQAIAACHALFAAGQVTRGLVIAPASLKSQWLREWQETTGTPVAVVDGTPAERAHRYATLRSGFLILNYEQLLRDLPAIQALAPDLVVLDEAQRIKNYATKSAVYVKALTPAYRIVLTGTPMENRLEELASILDWVDDVALAPKWRLVPWHTRWEGDGSAPGKAGARNLDTLRARLEPCLLRRVRREVLTQLPPRTDTRVPVELTPQQADEHAALNPPIAALLGAGRQRPLRQPEFLKLMQLLTQQRIIANGIGQHRFEEVWPAYAGARPDAALLEGLFAPKLGELRRLITDLVIEQRRKVVIFSQWRRMLRLAAWSVSDLLGDQGLRAVFFTGAEKPSQRTRSIVDFHDEAAVPVMFLSDAGGVGLNLQKAASACINLELPWNPAVLEQRIGRIYRLGQGRPIDVYNLISEGSIEARIAMLVGSKQALFSSVFDGTTDEVRFESSGSFLTRVERMVAPTVPTAAPLPATGPRGDDAAEGDPAASADDTRREDAALADDVPGLPLTSTPTSNANAQLVPEARLGAEPMTGADQVAQLFARVRVERLAGGALRIEAPPEAASSLASMFEGMARLLSAAVRGG